MRHENMSAITTGCCAGRSLMVDVVRIALVGCGGMMGSHVEHGYQQLWEKGIRTFRIIGCCDVEEDRARLWPPGSPHGRAKSPHMQRLRHVSESSEVDAVDISVLHSEHHRVAIPCLERQARHHRKAPCHHHARRHAHHRSC